MDIIDTFGTNAELWAALVAAILPAVVAWVVRADWSAEAKGAVAVVTAVLAGAGTAYVSGHWSGEDILRSVLIVAFLSQVAYQTFWKPSGIGSRIERRHERDETPRSITA